MNKPFHYFRLLAGLALAAAQPAAAQDDKKQDDKKVYTYAEQMPELPGHGGPAAISAAVQQRFRYPADALRNHIEGRIFVQFTVSATGEVADVRVIKGLSASTDAAAVDAVRQLPRFEPGRQDGQPVAVSFTMPITLRMVRLPAGSGPR